MSLLSRTCLVLAVLPLVCGLVPAQQPATPIARPVTLSVIASGAGADALTVNDLRLADNKTATPIRAMRQISDSTEPARVIVVVDAVNTAFTRVAYVRSQVRQFFKANDGKLANPTTFVVLTDTSTEVRKGFTQDGNALSAELGDYPAGLREIRRNTGVWGADERTEISLKALTLINAYAARIPGRKLVLWVSPGWPLLSGPHIDLDDKQQKQVFTDVVGYSRSLRLANVTLYNINPIGPEEGLGRETYYQAFLKGVRKSSEVELADLSLQVLAVQSGGRTIIGNSDVAGSMAKCLTDTAAWYEITFDSPPAEHANEYHHVQIEATKPGLTLRTRDGYYAQP